jgi:RES domain-containing protein
MVYTAESRSLAALEILVHAEDTGLLSAAPWVVIPVEIDEQFIYVPERLPKGWQAIPAPRSTQVFGDHWVQAGRSVAMRIPSVVTPGEFNLLINPLHRDIARLRIGEAIGFRFDGRLL